MKTQTDSVWGEAFAKHERAIWGLCYRMTASAADADDLVQDTFARAMERPPEALEGLRPWLTTVALNLSRDLLRARQRKSYIGPWLPAPIEDAQLEAPIAYEIEGPHGTEARYDMMESVSFAFLLALETLSPTARAILLLRDVFDYSIQETASALELSAANVKVTLHRARKKMATYDQARCILNEERRARSEQALTGLLGGLVSGDVGAIERLLARDVKALSDGGGEFHAATRPIFGRDHVIRFYMGVLGRRGLPVWFEQRSLNGLPAVLSVFGEARPREAKKLVTRVEVDDRGQILELHTILATPKLSALSFG